MDDHDLTHCLTQVRWMPRTYPGVPYVRPSRIRLASNAVIQGISIVALAPMAIAIGIVEVLREIGAPAFIVFMVGCGAVVTLIVSVPWLLLWLTISFFIREGATCLEKRHRNFK